MPPQGTHADSRERARRAFELRCAARTWPEIATALGFKSASSACNAVDRYVRRQPPENLASARLYAGGGLRLVQATLFEMLGEAKRRKDVNAAATVSRAIAEITHKHAMLVPGMIVPVAQQVDVTVHQSAAAVLERAEADLTRAIEAAPEILDAEIVEAS